MSTGFLTPFRTAFLSGVLGYKALFSWNTPWLFATSLLLTPLLQIAFFVVLGGAFNYQNPTFFIVGNALQLVASAGIFGLVSVIADERRFGTLTFVLLSPTSRIAVFLGRMFPGVILGLLVALITSGIGLTLVAGLNAGSAGGFWQGYPLPGSSFALYALAAAAAALSCAGLGLALSALGLVYRETFQIAGAAYLLLLIVSGANLNRADLPDWVQWLGNFLPTTHSIDAARALVSGADPALALRSLLLEFLIGVAWTVLALVFMRRLEIAAKRRAALDIY